MKEFKVAIIGQIARWKGQDVFIKAAKLLHPKYPEIKFLLIGDVLFEKEEELQFKNHLLDLAKDCDYIEFLGHRENVLELLKDIDILVHASVREEPFGRVIIEGMASKIPVIAAKIGGPLEIIEDGISGILYEPGNVRNLVSKLNGLIEDEHLYKSIASGGNKRFLEKFSLKKTVSKVEECIGIVSKK
ncbi:MULTISPECIES: glycosyltransferase family 4 protein [Bacillaceae]|uniref:glycosyltransferase family 4 protein n=1 Tax=Bacillaceae TaxID=186817 RepID=UPI0006613AA7|nr:MULTISPECIES: glycosyltransferase family 4 protein [Bacillaceae]MCF2649151.1 glycosyltransferase family 4 protein [Niallia circulans]